MNREKLWALPLGIAVSSIFLGIAFGELGGVAAGGFGGLEVATTLFAILIALKEE